MHSLVRRIFHRLQTLDPVDEEGRLTHAIDTPVEGEVKMSIQSLHDISATSVVGTNIEKMGHDTLARAATPTVEQTLQAPQPLPDDTVPRADCE